MSEQVLSEQVAPRYGASIRSAWEADSFELDTTELVSFLSQAPPRQAPGKGPRKGSGKLTYIHIHTYTHTHIHTYTHTHIHTYTHTHIHTQAQRHRHRDAGTETQAQGHTLTQNFYIAIVPQIC